MESRLVSVLQELAKQPRQAVQEFRDSSPLSSHFSLIIPHLAFQQQSGPVLYLKEKFQGVKG